MKRIAILCPGRGSYVEKTLRSLPDAHPWVTRADELRRERGLVSLFELDRASKFDSKVHLLPENVSPLIYLVSMLDAAARMQEDKCVAVAGNSMGWYTALAVAGAISFDDGFQLVQEMSILQRDHQAEHGGGQIIYPSVDDQWKVDGERLRSVESALASSNGEAFRSIDLGGYWVLAGSEAGIAHLLTTLPKVKVGATMYPFRLMQHGAYHTQLVEGVSVRARSSLAGLNFQRPRVTLIDGHGRRYTPWSADVAAMREYTLGAQVTTLYDFALSIRVALREFAPDHLVCPGPGNSLGGVCGQVVVNEGWRGVHSKDDFQRVQDSDNPILVSMRR
ncbi:MAG: ACP S-malonyltransferase [Planctomycetes bacterium]|nr:ACP S-malonyltransferase [Planctomycetota bacterium]